MRHDNQMAPARLQPPGAWPRKEHSRDARILTRRAGPVDPVYSGNRRVPGLYERELANGSTVYDAALASAARHAATGSTATTKTDAINELRALQVDYERGEAHRSPAAGLTLDELARDYLAHLRVRTTETDPRRRRSPRTVEHYDSQLRLHVLPCSATVPAAELTVARRAAPARRPRD